MRRGDVKKTSLPPIQCLRHCEAGEQDDNIMQDDSQKIVVQKTETQKKAF